MRIQCSLRLVNNEEKQGKPIDFCRKLTKGVWHRKKGKIQCVCGQEWGLCSKWREILSMMRRMIMGRRTVRGKEERYPAWKWRLWEGDLAARGREISNILVDEWRGIFGEDIERGRKRVEIGYFISFLFIAATRVISNEHLRRHLIFWVNFCSYGGEGGWRSPRIGGHAWTMGWERFWTIRPLHHKNWWTTRLVNSTVALLKTPSSSVRYMWKGSLSCGSSLCPNFWQKFEDWRAGNICFGLFDAHMWKKSV